MKRLRLFILLFVAAFCYNTEAQISLAVSIDSLTSVGVKFIATASGTLPANTTLPSRGFIYAKQTTPNTVTKLTKSLSGNAAKTVADFSDTIATTTQSKLLEANTTYQVRAFYRQKHSTSPVTYDTVFSPYFTFTTPPRQCTESSVRECEATTLSTASVEGSIDAIVDAYKLIGYGFVYSTSPNPDMHNANFKKVSPNTVPKVTTQFSTTLTSLLSATTYYYRAFVISQYRSNENDTCYSEQKTFVTQHACGNVPSDLDTISVGMFDAQLQWVPKEGQIKWEVDYGLAGHLAGEGSSVMVTSPNATITGLLSNRAYSVFVRAVCESLNLYSEWSDLKSFKTLPSPCENVSGVHLTDVTHFTAKIEWTPGSIVQDSWDIMFARKNQSYPAYYTVKNEPVYSPVGLTPNTEYKFKVRSNCDPNFGEWSDEFTFFTSMIGLEEQATDTGKVVVYPNPSDNTIYFQTDKKKVKKLEIYNVLGERVYQTDILPEQLQLKPFGQGTYYIIIETESGVQTEKIIIN